MSTFKFFEKLLDGKSAMNAEGKLGPVEVANIQELTNYIVFGAGSSAGAVVIESAHDKDFTGTWHNLATVTWAAASRVHEVQITGLHNAIRHRISVAIVGGTVDSYIMGN